ncbi:hypothetical protein GN958_ATG15478 [Phytophthora infestans]|uniref:Uncharacterized protein n=1 Tax=Phytophthora infestans TaxID=4787 RepID=A0A8S9U3X0_PHYIN|nr:hypothetical protein GN958_ATG15478 [Phytophthora infestans]
MLITPMSWHTPGKLDHHLETPDVIHERLSAMSELLVVWTQWCQGHYADDDDRGDIGDNRDWTDDNDVCSVHDCDLGGANDVLECEADNSCTGLYAKSDAVSISASGMLCRRSPWLRSDARQRTQISMAAVSSNEEGLGVYDL